MKSFNVRREMKVKMIEQMSLEEKIGQLFVVTTPHSSHDGEIIHLLTSFHVSGVLIQHENVIRPQQLSNLIARMQMFANKELPLFIVSEHYGGEFPNLAKKLTKNFTEKELGIVNNRLYTKQYAEYKAKELCELNFNMIIKPPLHVSEDVKHSFGTEPKRVAHHSVATIDGHRKAGLLSVAKITPEQGVAIKRADWQRKPWIHNNSSLYPLHKVIKQNVDGVHIPFQMFETIAKPKSDDSVTRILEEYLQFSNACMTTVSLDEMNLEEQINTIVAAINHSVHLITLSGSYDAQWKTIEAIRQAVLHGEIERRVIERAVEKVLQLKEHIHVKELTQLNDDVFKSRRATDLIDKLENALKQ